MERSTPRAKGQARRSLGRLGAASMQSGGMHRMGEAPAAPVPFGEQGDCGRDDAKQPGRPKGLEIRGYWWR